MSAVYKVVLFVAICASLRVSVCSRDEKFNHLGSRTPYRFLQNNNAAPINYPDCEATKIWLFARHGTRLPGKSDINDMQTILPDLRDRIVSKYNAGRSSLNPHVISDFLDWKNDLNIDEAEDLTEEGEEELLLLGQRMQSRFPSAIPTLYDNKTHEFRSTPTQRAEESVRYFASGVFGEQEASKVWFTPTYEWDPVLRFYKVCDKYQEEVKNNPAALVEQTLYGESQTMTAALKKVSDLLGLDEGLTLAEAKLVYKACGFETAWEKDGHSPWCDIFDKDFAKTLEYYDDLDYYWIDGYGYPLTYLPACVTVQDLFAHLSDDSKQSASFLFAHSGSLLKLQAHFGINEPSAPLTHSNEDEKRPWRSSPIDAFASNLAFVLYNCRDEDHVLTLFQEQIIRLPACKEDLCPLSLLTQEYHDSIDHCHFDEICSL